MIHVTFCPVFGVDGERMPAVFDARFNRRLLCTSADPLPNAARVLLGEGADPKSLLVAMRIEFPEFDVEVATLADAARGTEGFGENVLPLAQGARVLLRAMKKMSRSSLWEIERIMANPPARGVGGGVFVVVHDDPRRYFSVVHIKEFNIWQSGWIYTREDAELIAEMMAFHCGAKLVREVRI